MDESSKTSDDLDILSSGDELEVLPKKEPVPVDENREKQSNTDSFGQSDPTMQAKSPDDERTAKGAVFDLSALMTVMSLFMFVGGGIVTAIMLARAFDLHGQTLVAFIVAASSVVLGMAGALMLRSNGDKWWIGAMIGSSFGAMSALLIYAQTKNNIWWQ